MSEAAADILWVAGGRPLRPLDAVVYAVTLAASKWLVQSVCQSNQHNYDLPKIISNQNNQIYLMWWSITVRMRSISRSATTLCQSLKRRQSTFRTSVIVRCQSTTRRPHLWFMRWTIVEVLHITGGRRECTVWRVHWTDDGWKEKSRELELNEWLKALEFRIENKSFFRFNLMKKRKNKLSQMSQTTLNELKRFLYFIYVKYCWCF